VQQQPHELQRFGLLATLGREPPRPARCEVRAGRKRDQQIPAVAEDVAHVALIVPGAALRREDVAGDGEVPAGREGIAHGAGELAGGEDSHARPQENAPGSATLDPGQSRRVWSAATGAGGCAGSLCWSSADAPWRGGCCLPTTDKEAAGPEGPASRSGQRS